MGYRSRNVAAVTRMATVREQLVEAETQARDALGGILPFRLESRLAKLERRLEHLDGTAAEINHLVSELDDVLTQLRDLDRVSRFPREVDEAFVEMFHNIFSWRRTAARRHRPRTDELTRLLQRIDPDAAVTTAANTLEAKLSAHRAPLYFAARLGREVEVRLATPVPRTASQVVLRPYRWWRWRDRRQGPAELGHHELDGRFSLAGERGAAFDAEVCEALAHLCHYDEPTVLIVGATATVTWTYDVAYEPLAAGVRVLAALRRAHAPARKRRRRKRRRPPPPRPTMLPVVPARLK